MAGSDVSGEEFFDVMLRAAAFKGDRGPAGVAGESDARE
jgi:hypothetical protein